MRIQVSVVDARASVKCSKRKILKEKTVMNRDSARGFGIGLLSGVIIGGVVALLYAPKTGKQTRQMIKDKTTEVVEVVKEKTGSVIDSVKESASEASRKGQAAVKAVKS
jgi:gas vesicle protein